jgi:hypothetical protein
MHQTYKVFPDLIGFFSAIADVPVKFWFGRTPSCRLLKYSPKIGPAFLLLPFELVLIFHAKNFYSPLIPVFPAFSALCSEATQKGKALARQTETGNRHCGGSDAL